MSICVLIAFIAAASWFCSSALKSGVKIYCTLLIGTGFSQKLLAFQKVLV